MSSLIVIIFATGTQIYCIGSNGHGYKRPPVVKTSQCHVANVTGS